MSNNNRKIFKERIQSLVVTHDMYKRPKDPSSQRMKAEDWNIFIITVSVWAAEGLVNDHVLETWVFYRNAYMNYLGGNFTAEKRVAARGDLVNYGRGLETHLDITACTISNHLVIVEADHQIPVTGPVAESTGSWVERFMNRLTEYVKRRFVIFLPTSVLFSFFFRLLLTSGLLPYSFGPFWGFLQEDCGCPGEGDGPGLPA